MFETIWARTDAHYKEVLEPTLELAIEIAREGREGHRIGTIFTIGDADAVLERSRPLILDPLACHLIRAATSPSSFSPDSVWQSVANGNSPSCASNFAPVLLPHQHDIVTVHRPLVHVTVGHCLGRLV